MTSNCLLLEQYLSEEVKLHSNVPMEIGVCTEALLVLENDLEAEVPFFSH